MQDNLIKPYSKLILCLCLFLVHCILWCATGHIPYSPNDYNSYALQAQSWLNGRLDVPYCSWLEQAIYQGKTYISFPPIPSVVLLPMVFFFGLSVPDHLFSFLACIIGASCAYDIALQFGRSRSDSFFWAFFLTAASNLISVTMLGWVWFMAQSFAFAFTMASFRFATCKNSRFTGLSLFFLACAVGCRPFNIVFFPYLFYLLWQNLPQKNLHAVLHRLWWLIPPALVAAFLCTLNGIRFGSIFEFGHNYLPEFLKSPFGQFNLRYIPRNLYNCIRVFAKDPRALQFDGWAFYLVMPIYVSALLSFLPEKRTPNKQYWLLLATMLVHLLLTCAHKTMGGWHFGCRYLIDATPLAYLMCMLRKQKKPYAMDVALMVLGLFVNITGTIIFYRY